MNTFVLCRSDRERVAIPLREIVLFQLFENEHGILRLKIRTVDGAIIETNNQDGDEATIRTFEKLVALMNGEEPSLPDPDQPATTAK